MPGATKLLTPGGGGVTLQPASSIASDVVVQVPSVAGTVMNSGAMPAFSAYLGSNQSITANTWTKVQVNTKNFDTASAYDNTTNYRFQPTVAGYYQISGGAYSAGSPVTVIASIYKIGSEWARGTWGSASNTASQLSSLIYLNGSTDYVELYAYFSGTGLSIGNGQAFTFFTGALVRAA